MTVSARPVLRLWFAERSRSSGERAYLVYLTAMVGLVVGVPFVRAVTLGVATIPAFSADRQVLAVLLVCTGLWLAALAAGRERGPALYPPALTHVLAVGPVPRIGAFGRPVARAIAVLAVAAGAVTGVSVASRVAAGSVSVEAAVRFIGAGVAAGVIAGVLWLAGQAAARFVSATSAGVIVVLGVGAVTWPEAFGWSPGALVAAVYPVSGVDRPALLVVVALAAVSLIAVPWLLRGLRYADLVEQAERWDAAQGLALSADLGAIGDRYRARPSWGRRWTAVRPSGSVTAMLVRRDAIATFRTPLRALVGLIALTAAGALTTWAVTIPQTVWVAAGPAGLLAYAGAGALTDGVRHVAAVVRSAPLYGIGDRSLMIARLWAPLVLGTVAVLVGVAIVAESGTWMRPALSAVLLAWVAVLARSADALKGPMPVSLLSPMPTPMGDFSALNRAIWVFDAALVMVAAGLACAFFWTAPWVAALVGVVLAGVLATRWSTRRASAT